MSFKDHFSGHASEYAAARPDYPSALFTWLAELSPGHRQAWDAGCGNGQAARALAAHFERVLATDASAEQIDNATPVAGVTFRTSPAEQCPLSDASCDLVTAAQAAHWFDRPRFYAEVVRVLRPRGIVALWCYGLNRISPEVDELVHRLYDDTLGSDWPPERALIDAGYRTIEFPFAEQPAPELMLEQHWNVDAYLAYLRSWSATQRHRARTGRDPLLAIEDALRKRWGDQRRRIVWPLHFRVGVRDG